MNILLLDSPYSKYFNDLCIEIFNKTNINEKNIYLFSQFKSYKLYNPKSKFIRIKNHLDKNTTIDLLKNKKIDMALIYNGCRHHHEKIIEVLNNYNIHYFTFERGLFRPYTTSLGINSGINANMQINSMLSEYTKLPLVKRQHFSEQDLSTPTISKKDVLNYFIFSLGQEVERCIYGLKQHRTLYQKVKNIICLKMKKLKPAKKFLIEDHTLLVALQLEHDTQFTRHSNFKDNQEFINSVEDLFQSSFPSKWKLVFKPHPKDAKNYKFQKSSHFAQEISLPDKSKYFILTINSTFGLEQIFKGKKVLFAGETYYQQHLSCKIDLKTTTNLFEEFLEKRYSESEVISLKENLLRFNQVTGNIFSYKNDNIEAIAEVILYAWRKAKLAQKV